jgi:ATPase subunit of ABC transporter with duplicated ATPase domains
MISLRNFALRRGERLLLSNVDLTLHAGYRVGVVGRNGAGKSSLFAAVKGELEADKGDVDLPGKVRIASVAQETPSLPDPALSFVLGGDIEVAAVLAAEAEATAREDWERWPRRTRRWPSSTPTTPKRAPASCCTASASRPRPTTARCPRSPAAGACA